MVPSTDHTTMNNVSNLLVNRNIPPDILIYLHKATLSIIQTVATDRLLSILTDLEIDQVIDKSYTLLPRKTLVALARKNEHITMQQPPIPITEHSETALSKTTTNHESQPGGISHSKHQKQTVIEKTKHTLVQAYVDSLPDEPPIATTIKEFKQKEEAELNTTHDNPHLSKQLKKKFLHRSSEVITQLVNLEVRFPSVCTKIHCVLCTSFHMAMAVTPCQPICKGHPGFWTHPTERTLKYLSLLHDRNRLLHVLIPRSNEREVDDIGSLYEFYEAEMLCEQRPSHFDTVMKHVANFINKGNSGEHVDFESDCSASAHSIENGDRKRKPKTTGSKSSRSCALRGFKKARK